MSGLTTKGEATRQRIVDAAADLMHRQGVERTSTADVESAAGVSSSQIYHYFADKEALTGAVVARQVERILDLQVQLLSSGDGVAALERWRDEVVAMQTRFGFVGGCPLGSLTSELVDTAPQLRPDLAAGFDRWQAVLSSVLQGMADRGELAPGVDPDTVALALLAAFQGGVIMSQARHDTVALEAAIDTVLDVLRRPESQPPLKRSRP